MRKPIKKIFLFLMLILTVVFCVYYALNYISNSRQEQIILQVSTELNGLPNDIENLNIQKGNVFSNNFYTITFRSSTLKINEWIKRNTKNIIQSETMPSIKQWLLKSENPELYFVQVKNNNNVKIQVRIN